MSGLDALGGRAIVVGSEQPSQRVVVLRVKNPLAMAKAQGPFYTPLATFAVPDMVDARENQSIADRLRDEFQKRGGDVDTWVLDAASVPNLPAPRPPGDARSFGVGAALGALAGAVAALLLKGRLKGRSA